MKTSVIRSLAAALILLPCLLSVKAARAQCSTAPSLVFHSPVLIGGTDGQVGAVYLFAEVAPGLDARIEVTGIYGGATLFNIDDSAGIGYYDAFQPYVGAGANDTSYIDWRISFKKGGTNNDSSLPCLAVTGVDVDGDGSNLKEFIEAATPGSFSVDPGTNLDISFDGVRSKAISPVANIPLIDTSHREAMFQMNFENITTLDYRNGAITTAGAQVRQTCIYFKPFFSSYIILPASLLSFGASVKNDIVSVRWKAAAEHDIDHYTLQRRINDGAWIGIGNIAVGKSAAANDYSVADVPGFGGPIYYRLIEFLKNGQTRSSSIVKVSISLPGTFGFSHGTIFRDAIQVQSSIAISQIFTMSVYDMTGNMIVNRKYTLHAGRNTTVIPVASLSRPGIYVLSVRNSEGRPIYRGKLIRTD